MIELIPAIDIIEGKCVRLTKGNYDTKTVYGDPVDMAKMLEDKGFTRLHMVDLDGAKSKHIVNVQVLNAITSTTALTVDFGGGIKTDDDITKAFDNGAAMVTIGSVAISNPDLFDGWLDKYGAEKIILGADVRNGKISINGWKEDSDTDLLPFLERYVRHGVKTVLYQLHASTERDEKWTAAQEGEYETVFLKGKATDVDKALCPGVIPWLEKGWDAIVICGNSSP